MGCSGTVMAQGAYRISAARVALLFHRRSNVAKGCSQSCHFVAIYDAVMLQRLGSFAGTKGDLHVKWADVADGTRWTPGWVPNSDCFDFGYGNGMAGRTCAAGKGCDGRRQDSGGLSADSCVRYDVA